MSHPSNISIPARFTFRPYRAKWEVCWAETIDWAEEPKLGVFLIPLPPPRGGDKVLVSVHLPSEETQPGDISGMLYPFAPPCTVEIDRADIPNDALPAHENRQNTPDISGREFLLFTCRMQEARALLLRPELDEMTKDPWKMRAEFLDLEQDPHYLRLFLNRWGLWNSSRGYAAGMRNEPHPFILTFPHMIWEQRDRYRRALAGKARPWLTIASPLNFSRLDEPPYFVVERSYCQDAIEATITIDHLSKATFGICKRHDCRKLYSRETRQKRLYCSPECAHLANVRKLRAEKKKAESKRRKYATRKD